MKPTGKLIHHTRTNARRPVQQSITNKLAGTNVSCLPQRRRSRPIGVPSVALSRVDLTVTSTLPYNDTIECGPVVELQDIGLKVAVFLSISR